MLLGVGYEPESCFCLGKWKEKKWTWKKGVNGMELAKNSWSRNCSFPNYLTISHLKDTRNWKRENISIVIQKLHDRDCKSMAQCIWEKIMVNSVVPKDYYCYKIRQGLWIVRIIVWKGISMNIKIAEIQVLQGRYMPQECYQMPTLKKEKSNFAL